MSDHPELCVGAVVVHEGALLMIERGRGVGVGSWSIPGGRVELGEPLARAAERELAEETALVGRAVAPLGWVERIGPQHHFLIVNYTVDVASRDGATAGDDAAALEWVPLPAVPHRAGVTPGLVDFLTEHGVLEGI